MILLDLVEEPIKEFVEAFCLFEQVVERAWHHTHLIATLNAQSLILCNEELGKVRNARFLDAIFDACSTEVPYQGLEVILANQQLAKLV